jgi:hypothetical protein
LVLEFKFKKTIAKKIVEEVEAPLNLDEGFIVKQKLQNVINKLISCKFDQNPNP